MFLKKIIFFSIILIRSEHSAAVCVIDAGTRHAALAWLQFSLLLCWVSLCMYVPGRNVSQPLKQLLRESFHTAQ